MFKKLTETKISASQSNSIGIRDVSRGIKMIWSSHWASVVFTDIQATLMQFTYIYSTELNHKTLCTVR